MKSLLSSTTIQGVLITVGTMILSMKGIHVDKDEAHGIISGLASAWPELLAIITALAAAWHRVQAWDFDKSVLFSRTFWLGIASAVISAMHAAGMPIDGLQDLADQIASFIVQMGPLLGSIMIVVGRTKAKLPLRIERARPF